MLVIILIFDLIIVYLSGQPSFIRQINNILKSIINKLYMSLNID